MSQKNVVRCKRHMYLVLLYDIALASEEPERTEDARALRRVFKTCKKHLTHIQNSVFEGELSEPQLMALKNELNKALRKDKDSCIIFRGRNNVWMTKEFLTKPQDQTSQFI
ncbi:MAG: CRISPR-associated endonuclease Cas2 [Christensenellaceae bacterium]